MQCKDRTVKWPVKGSDSSTSCRNVFHNCNLISNSFPSTSPNDAPEFRIEFFSQSSLDFHFSWYSSLGMPIFAIIHCLLSSNACWIAFLRHPNRWQGSTCRTCINLTLQYTHTGNGGLILYPNSSSSLSVRLSIPDDMMDIARPTPQGLTVMRRYLLIPFST